jgi:predicted NACHT family NTPase
MLPREFLSQVAEQYGLSQEQQQVFLAKFGSDKSDQKIMDACNISDGTLRYRLGEIYRKFSIAGKGTGKAHQLLCFLTNEYQKYNASGSASSNASQTDAEPTQKKQQDTNEIDALVQEVRSRIHDKIQYQCGTMRMLDISYPVVVSDIYTDVNILEQISSQQWRDIPDLLKEFNPESDDFDTPGHGKGRQRVPGLDAVSRYSKLMLLGKPGAGKTTFLQWVAIKCDLGEFQLDRVPIFIQLKNFAEDTRRDDSKFKLLNYISQEFSDCGIADKSIIEMILNKGKALILLDGLDEVSEEDDEVVKQIRLFINKYFQNKFIISCRIAAQKYRFSLEKFTDVEVAGFNDEQVEVFAKKWFVTVARNDWEKGEGTARRFLEKLNLPHNKQIRELAETPILLNLTCFVFQTKREFPQKRFKLYKQGLDILLEKWDEERGIQRDEVYRNLSLDHKIELLTQIAAITFTNSRYFFEQEEVERYIADYISTLPNAQTNRAILQRDSKRALKSIEAQHGLLVERMREIYSFSHLTFQEYFVAREIFVNSAWKSLVEHITEKRWREVFLLTAGMMQKADDLLGLMKRKVDDLLAGNEKLQRFLGLVNEKAVNEKAKSVEVRYKCAAVRAFYLASLNENFIFLFGDIDRQYQPGFKFHKSRDFCSDICFTKAGVLIRLFIKVENFIIDFELLSYSQKVEYNIQNILKKLQEQIPNPYNDQERFDQWIKDNSQAWTEQLRKVIVKHPNLAHDCQFSEAQKELLGQYYDANKLLVDCLNSGCEVSSAVRQEIEDTLLLPIAEIEKCQQQIS